MRGKSIASIKVITSKENSRLKINTDIQSVSTASKNPLLKVRKEDTKKQVIEEAARIQRKGRLSFEDFTDVLKNFEFKHNKPELIEKTLKSVMCYYAGTKSVYYLKLLKQLWLRASHYNKISKTFDYYRPIVTFEI